MKKYCIYDDDGNILRSGISSERSFNSKAKEGEHIADAKLYNQIDIIEQ